MSSVRAPTGDIERWLITDKDSGGVYGVDWQIYWFDARASGAQFYMDGNIGRLEVVWHPPSPEEKATGQYLSGKELAALHGLKLHGTKDVRQFPPDAPKRWVQCREVYTFKNGITSIWCTHEKGHDGKHKGWRKEWE